MPLSEGVTVIIPHGKAGARAFSPTAPSDRLTLPPLAALRYHGFMAPFKLVSDFTPKGDQPQAIEALIDGLDQGLHHQVLLGVTGSGKTFTMANVIERWGRPTLVIAHNKTLAAQLYTEFRELFPDNAVEFFVSYYDYYQPEAYVPRTDTYIEKDASINDQIDKMRHSATRSLLERRDVIIVASVSCIYVLLFGPSPQQAVFCSLHAFLYSRHSSLHAAVRAPWELIASYRALLAVSWESE